MPLNTMLFVSLLVFASCVQKPREGEVELVETPEEFERGLVRQMIGGWQATVRNADAPPFWFEIEEEKGMLSGRLQTRDGPEVKIDRMEASPNRLTMEAARTTYTGEFNGHAWRGTAETEHGVSFVWTAVPAPVRPAWGSP